MVCILLYDQKRPVKRRTYTQPVASYFLCFSVYSAIARRTAAARLCHHPRIPLHALLVLQFFVGGIEMLYFFDGVFVDVSEIAHLFPARVRHGNRNDFVISISRINHAHERNWPRTHQNPGASGNVVSRITSSASPSSQSVCGTKP